MKVLVIEPGKQPVVKEIGNTLKDMQRMVGGYIQAYYPWMDEVAIICNDEGKIMDLPFNRPVFGEHGELVDIIAGTFFLGGAPPEEEHFVSLTEPQIAWLSRRFAWPERFWKTGRQLLVLPAEGGQ